MSLVFSAITPHSPLLLPTIGREQIKKITSTKTALENLEADLYITKPHLIMVISPHGPLYDEAFAVNAHTSFMSYFVEFGDLSTKKKWIGAPEVAAGIGHQGYQRDVPIRLISQDHIDHGVSIPLFYLTNHLPNVKVLPIGYSGLSPKDHLRFGELLKDVIMDTDKRVALIASGDLSHALNSDSPAGFNKAGKLFDEQIITLLETRNTTGILNLETDFIKSAAECGYRSLLILLGVLKNMNYTFKNYCYESPFGVGYLTGNFVF